MLHPPTDRCTVHTQRFSGCCSVDVRIFEEALGDLSFLRARVFLIPVNLALACVAMLYLRKERSRVDLFASATRGPARCVDARFATSRSCACSSFSLANSSTRVIVTTCFPNSVCCDGRVVTVVFRIMLKGRWAKETANDLKSTSLGTEDGASEAEERKDDPPTQRPSATAFGGTRLVIRLGERGVREKKEEDDRKNGVL